MDKPYGYGVTVPRAAKIEATGLGPVTHIYVVGDWNTGRVRKTSVTRLDDGTEIIEVTEIVPPNENEE